MFMMNTDSHRFRETHELEERGWALSGNVFKRGDESYLPLYEAKMVHQFHHRFGDYGMKEEKSENTALPEVPVERLQDPVYAPLPRYWVPSSEVESRLAGKWSRDWLLGWRDICRSTDERTVIAGVIPRAGVGNQFPLMLASAVDFAPLLPANLSAFALDFAARQKVGGTHLNFFIYNQLPVLAPETYREEAPWALGVDLAAWLSARTVELTYTAHDLKGFAEDLGYTGPPFGWDETRRIRLRCELDAAFFHLYGIPRADIDYIMDTFPIVRRNDEQKYGDYRTKNLILEIYDELQRAIDTGKPFVSRLDPPAGDPRAAHGAS